MLFLVGTVLGVYMFVEKPLELLLPLAAIILRAGYLCREVVIYRFAPVVVAVIAFAAPVAVPAFQTLFPGMSSHRQPLSSEMLLDSFMFAGRMFLTVLVLLNLREDPSLSGIGQFMMRPFARLGVLVQLMTQNPAEVTRRAADVLYAARMRLRREGSVSERVRLFRNATVALTIEMACMANEVAVVVGSRGNMPRIRLWKIAPKGVAVILLSDTLLLAIVALVMFVIKSRPPGM